MNENQMILQLHEELLNINRELKNFKNSCNRKLMKQKTVNRLLACCLIAVMAEKTWKKFKNMNGKGISNTK